MTRDGEPHKLRIGLTDPEGPLARAEAIFLWFAFDGLALAARSALEAAAGIRR